MNNVKELTILALFLSISILLSIIENSVFIPIGIPGIKLGLANTMFIIVLYFYGFKKMVLINLTRVILVGVIVGTIFSIPFVISFFSVLLSSLVVFFVDKVNKLSIYGVSMIQAVTFNLSQILVVTLLYQNRLILYYSPYLVLSGLITGYIVAYTAVLVINIITKTILL